MKNITKKHKDFMTPELAKKLNERKEFHDIKKKKLIDNKFKKFWKKYLANPDVKEFKEQTKPNEENKEYFPKINLPEGFSLFDQTPKPSHKQQTKDNVLSEEESQNVMAQLHEQTEAKQEIERINKLSKDKLQEWLNEPETE